MYIPQVTTQLTSLGPYPSPPQTVLFPPEQSARTNAVFLLPLDIPREGGVEHSPLVMGLSSRR